MKPKRITFGIVFLLFVCTSTIVTSQSIYGCWKGTLTVQSMEIPLVSNITYAFGTMSSTMDSPLQGVTDIPMDETSFVDNTYHCI